MACLCESSVRAFLIESSRLLQVSAYNNVVMCFWQHMSHGFIHTEASGGGGGNRPFSECTAVSQPNDNYVEMCGSTGLDGENVGCLQSPGSANHSER